MIKVELTEKEFDCLLGHMQVDIEMFQEVVEEDPSYEYGKVMLSLIERFENIRLNHEEFHK